MQQITDFILHAAKVRKSARICHPQRSSEMTPEKEHAGEGPARRRALRDPLRRAHFGELPDAPAAHSQAAGGAPRAAQDGKGRPG